MLSQQKNDFNSKFFDTHLLFCINVMQFVHHCLLRRYQEASNIRRPSHFYQGCRQELTEEVVLLFFPPLFSFVPSPPLSLVSLPLPFHSPRSLSFSYLFPFLSSPHFPSFFLLPLRSRPLKPARGLGSAVSSLSGVRGGAPAEIEFGAL